MLLEVGYVSRALGLRGEIAVKTFDPSSEALFEVPRMVLERNQKSHTCRIDSIQSGPKFLRLQLENVINRTQAESLVGAKVYVFREDLPPLKEGEWFYGDLVGLTAKDKEDRALGIIEEIQDFGPVPNLVIRSSSGEEWLVPWAEVFILEIAVEKGWIRVDPPQYLE